MTLYWFMLALAIAGELLGTCCLKAAAGFTKLWPSLGVAVGYIVSFYLMSVIVKHLPVGIVYALWSGVGTIAIAIVGMTVFREQITAFGWLGIALVVAGVAILSWVMPGIR
jgi:small multidrug resistance pump